MIKSKTKNNFFQKCIFILISIFSLFMISSCGDGTQTKNNDTNFIEIDL